MEIQQIKTEFIQVLNDVFSGVRGITLELAITATTAIMQEAGKYSRQLIAINSGKVYGTTGEYNEDKPISEKQKNYLKDLGVKEMPATSREASAVIEQIKRKKGGQPSSFRVK